MIAGRRILSVGMLALFFGFAGFGCVTQKQAKEQAIQLMARRGIEPGGSPVEIELKQFVIRDLVDREIARDGPFGGSFGAYFLFVSMQEGQILLIGVDHGPRIEFGLDNLIIRRQANYDRITKRPAKVFWAKVGNTSGANEFRVICGFNVGSEHAASYEYRLLKLPEGLQIKSFRLLSQS